MFTCVLYAFLVKMEIVWSRVMTSCNDYHALGKSRVMTSCNDYHALGKSRVMTSCNDYHALGKSRGILESSKEAREKAFPKHLQTFSRRFLYIYSWIYENMIDENYSCFTKTGPNKGSCKPDDSQNRRKERKEGKGARARKKRLATVFSFYSVDFGDSIYIYIYSIIYVFSKILKYGSIMMTTMMTHDDDNGDDDDGDD